MRKLRSLILAGALALVLVGFVQTDAPWFGLDKDGAEHLRAVGPVVAVWLLVFAFALGFGTTVAEPVLVKADQKAEIAAVKTISTVQAMRR